ncbi:MAG: hypothetical protein OHK0031_16630 [Anaerolineales bacterium]
MKRIFIITTLCLFLLAAAFGLMRFLQGVVPFTLGIDLIPRWVGAQSMLKGISPYGLESRRQVWQVIYGSTQTPQGNPFGFYYPPAITTLLFPFILAQLPLETATAAWCALLWLLWLAALAWLGRGEKPWALAALLVSGLAFRPAFSNYILGQTALFGVLAFGAAALLAQKKPAAAGILLSLALLKPSFLLLPVGIFLLLRRGRALWLGFALSLLALILPSFFLIGWWIPDFLSEISRYAQENVAAWSPAVDLGGWAGWLWLGLAAALSGWAALRREWGLALAAALALNAALVPHSADYDLVALLGLLWWLKGKISGPLFYGLVWFPWLTLFLLPGVESWYHFLWQSYPALLLAVAGLRFSGLTV